MWYAYMWSLKYDTQELIYETETLTGIENKLRVIKEGNGRKGFPAAQLVKNLAAMQGA